MSKFKIGDKVIFKLTPNPNEMIIVSIRDTKSVLFPNASKESPIYQVHFWDATKNEFQYEYFIESEIQLVGNS